MDNPPAFPRPHSEEESAPPYGAQPAQEGMTLRDYFAAQAMQAGVICAGLSDEYSRLLNCSADPLKKLAEGAYTTADAMLAARARPETPDAS